MSHHGRSTVLFALAALAAWIAGCGGSPSSGAGTACAGDEQCASDARCSSGGCVANSAPIAEFTVSDGAEAGAIVTMDGSASRDPDQGDAITSYAWTIERVEGDCEAPEVASAEALVKVRFGCAGKFKARLVVRDEKLAESEQVSRAIEVLARSGTALVEAGPDQVVDHRCAGKPLVCKLSTQVQLTAAANTPAGVRFRWSVQPPEGRELDEHRRVTFVPSADAQTPIVEIETDGTALSGDWLFRVEVQDDVGALDGDVTRVSVRNRVPVIVATPPAPVDHGYSDASKTFSASGSFGVQVSDPDGDPLERKVVANHTGDGGAVFEAEDLGTSIRFSVAVQRNLPEDARYLIGAAVTRTVVLTATDPNGGTVQKPFPVQVGNHPPERAALGGGTFPHSYHLPTGAYLAWPDLGRWSDPDGDPLTGTATADECSSSILQADGSFGMRCARFASAPKDGFLNWRSAAVAVSDPWNETTDTVSFQIGNQVLSLPNIPEQRPVIGCRTVFNSSNCPDSSQSDGKADETICQGATVRVELGSDPNGDPLTVGTSDGQVTSCGPYQTCTLTISIPAQSSCRGVSLNPRTLGFVVADGFADTYGEFRISPVNH